MSQAIKVLNHLRTRPKLTSVEAIGLYGITRLAAVVHSLKKEGHAIKSTMKTGVNAPYAEYTLH